MATLTIQQVLQLGAVPPGAKENLVGESFKYTSAGDHIVELLNALITITNHIASLQARAAALETAANITPDPKDVF